MHDIVIEALLVKAPDKRVRVILGSLCLDFDRQDIVQVEELAAPPGLIEGSALPARVTLRAGARLQRLATSQAYRDLLWQHRLPFALATRSASIEAALPGMLQREAEFFAARGLQGALR